MMVLRWAPRLAMTTAAPKLHPRFKSLLTALVVLAACAFPAFAATIPAAPTGFTVTGPLATQLTLSWTASSGATSYNVYRRNNSGVETLLQSKVQITTYEDSG